MQKHARQSCLVATTLFFSIAINASAQEAAKPAADIPSVSVTKAVEKNLTRSISFSGRVEAKDKVELRARIVGFLEKRLFTEGQDVKAGDLLFAMEKGPYEADVAKAQGAIVSGQSGLALANVETDRQSALVAKSAAPQSQLDVALANQKEAKGNLKQLQAALEKAELNLGYTDIKSPIEGRIGRSQYADGNFVGSASEVLATIVTQDPIYVDFSVSQREVLAIREKLGKTGKLGDQLDAAIVRIQLANGKDYAQAGKVIFVDVAVDQGTDTVAVRASFPNPDRLLSDGQLVNVSVEGGQPEMAVFVSQSAIQIDQSGPYALVVNNENKIEVRRIEPGPMQGTELTVTNGLSGGDRIVTEGIQKVRPGQVVDPVETNPVP